MKIGRWQITKLPDLPKRQRKLPLDKFYTFPNGISIYTYRDADLPLISGRYYDQVKNDMVFLQEYGITKEVVKKYDEALLNLTLEGLNRTGRQPGEVFADIKKLLDEKESLFKFNRSLHLQLWYNLFCMFFVLDGEDECQFSEAENKRKVELLETLPEVEQDFFFTYLEKKLNYYRDTLSQDLANYIMTEAEEATKIKNGSLGNSINTLIEMMHSTSTQVNTQG